MKLTTQQVVDDLVWLIESYRGLDYHERVHLSLQRALDDVKRVRAVRKILADNQLRARSTRVADSVLAQIERALGEG